MGGGGRAVSAVRCGCSGDLASLRWMGDCGLGNLQAATWIVEVSMAAIETPALTQLHLLIGDH